MTCQNCSRAAARATAAIGLAVLMAATMVANGHQMQVALTTVEFKARTGTVEVIHRFYTHDAEHAMSTLAGRRVDIMMVEEVRQALGHHVQENFRLLGNDGADLPLQLVGVELDDRFIWVYQEMPLPAPLDELVVVNAVLVDLVPGQVNTVNVECGDELSTLTFNARVHAAAVDFDLAACPAQWRQ